jgi:hypothetical protein
MAVVASWKLHSKAVVASNSIGHIEFRREVVSGLLKSSGRKRMGGPTAPVSGCVRYDGVDMMDAVLSVVKTLRSATSVKSG